MPVAGVGIDIEWTGGVLLGIEQVIVAPFPSVPSSELSELSKRVTGKPLANRAAPETVQSLVRISGPRWA